MQEILQILKRQDPEEKEFHQAVEEVMDSVRPVIENNPEYRQSAILERLVEPE